MINASSQFPRLGTSSFHESPTDVVHCRIGTAFKEQITLLASDSHLIAVTMTAGPYHCSLPDIYYTVNLKLSPVLLGDFSVDQCDIYSETPTHTQPGGISFSRHIPRKEITHDIQENE
jgi:hypothetical protein